MTQIYRLTTTSLIATGTEKIFRSGKQRQGLDQTMQVHGSLLNSQINLTLKMHFKLIINNNITRSTTLSRSTLASYRESGAELG